MKEGQLKHEKLAHIDILLLVGQTAANASDGVRMATGKTNDRTADSPESIVRGILASACISEKPNAIMAAEGARKEARVKAPLKAVVVLKERGCPVRRSGDEAPKPKARGLQGLGLRTL